MPSVSSEEQVQTEILTLMATLPQKTYEQAIPNSVTVVRTDRGVINPYYAIQFGDAQEGRAHSMSGPRGDDYGMPVYIQAVAPFAATARQMGNAVRWLLLGSSFAWSGSMRKRPGGGMFPIVASSGATEAYQMPASFFVPFQYADITAP